jgi:hypothetical protein
VDDLSVYLVPIDAGRFELYTEPPEDTGPAHPHPDEGMIRRLTHRLHQRWREMVHDAEREAAVTGWFARLRDRLVRNIAASIDGQRTLWSLRRVTSATLVYPADLSETSAVAIRGQMLALARTHHGRWLLVNLLGVAATAILVLLPGPNVIGYYFLFRVAGHFLAWQGARHALQRITWRTRPEPPDVFDHLAGR